MQKLRIQAPIISIIIPAYNSEKTINRCIDSILLQRFSDFELLLICLLYTSDAADEL